VAGFIGAPAMNFLSGTADGDGSVRLGGRAFRPARPAWQAGAVRIGIRPEHLSLVDPAAADIPGEVELVEKLGADSLLYVRTEVAGGPIVVRTQGGVAVRETEAVGLRIDPARMHVFPA